MSGIRELTRSKSYDLREADIREQIFEYLGKINVFCWRDKQGASPPGKGTFKSSKGIADIVGIYKGKPLAIEVKKPGGDLSICQFHWLNRFEKSGGITIVACSVEEVQKALSEVK
jgi:hypothetical protein